MTHIIWVIDRCRTLKSYLYCRIEWTSFYGTATSTESKNSFYSRTNISWYWSVQRCCPRIGSKYSRFPENPLKSSIFRNHRFSEIPDSSKRDFRDKKSIRTKVVDNLRLKSSNRIRTFLFEKIYQFRKPLANYHIPQNTMLRFRFFYEFLLANERPTAQEIKDEYLDTVSKVYYSYFRSYLQRLMKLKFSETATKLDMLGTGCALYWLALSSRALQILVHFDISAISTKNRKYSNYKYNFKGSFIIQSICIETNTIETKRNHIHSWK